MGRDPDRPDGKTLLATLRRRWAAGDRVPVEHFLAGRPAVAGDTELVLDLIYAEVLLRREAGGQPTADEYLARFPDLADPIRAQFEVDEALGADLTRTGHGSPPAEPPAGPPAPSGYEILGELGRGGMGVVYKARQKALDRLVALKVIRSGELADPAEHARFEAEALAVARLSHPNVVQIYEVGEANGRPFLALEYVAGGSLADALRGSPIAPRAAAALLATVARAVQHAHAAGVIHRDLKPANVLLARDGPATGPDGGPGRSANPHPSPIAGCQPKITDFGLAKLGGGSDLTRTGDALGTPSYMAPEQTGGPAAAVGPATDVYGLGAVLYESLTGRPPFQAESALAIVLRVQQEEPVPPRRLQPTVPRDLETICLKCLQKEPRHRYPSADALADDLQRFLDGRPIVARPVGAFGRAAKWARRHPATAALSGAIGVTAAVLFAVLVVSDVRIRQKQRETAAALQAETEARSDLARTLDRERQTLYLQRIRLAMAAVLANNVQQAQRDLQACLPGAGQRDLRGWEWYYLNRLCHAELVNFREHDHPVHSVAISPDGARVASVSAGKLKIWDTVSGRVLIDATGPEASGTCCFSPDGKQVAMGDRSRNLTRVYDAAGGRDLFTVPGIDPTYSPDGKHLAAPDAGRKRVYIYETATGEEVRTCPDPGHGVSRFAFRADGLWAAAVRPDRTIRVWNLETGGEGLVLPGQAAGNFFPTFSPDGRHLASAGEDGSIKLWDAASGREAGTINAHPSGNITSLVFSADGERIASADFGGSLKVWTIQGEPVQTLPGHGAPIYGLAFGPAGRLLASASVDRSVKIWDTGRDPNAVTFRGHTNYVLGLAFSPDGARLASGGFDGAVKVWESGTGRVLLDSPGRMGILCHLRFSPDGSRLAVCNTDTAVEVLSAETGKGLGSFQGRNSSRVVAVSSCGTYVAAAAKPDHGVKVWDLTTGRFLCALRGHADSVSGLVFSPDSGLLATSSHDHTTRIWEIPTGREVRTLRGHDERVTCVAFSADGTLLATGGSDEMIRLWDAQTGAEVRALPKPWGRHTIHTLAFSPDGRRLASGGNHAVVTLWDTETGQEVLQLPTARMIVTTVLFSPDGRRLAAVTNDGAVTVWDAPAADETTPRPTDR